MRKFRPSPAMVVAMVALFVAMSGSGYAAVTLSKNSVKARQIAPNAVGASEIKARAVRSSEVANGSLLLGDFKAGQIPAGAKGDKGEKGDKGDTGASATKLLGSIQANGTITRSQGVTSVNNTGAGTYTVTFNQDISQCYPLANIFAVGGDVVMDGITGNQLFVKTFNNTDVATNEAFYLAVLC